MSWIQKLKERWGIASNFQIVLILIVFTINGTFATWIAKPITEFVGISSETTSLWIYYPVRILLIFLIYQLTLLIFAFVFGQFKFFWGLKKKMFARFGRKSKGEKVW